MNIGQFLKSQREARGLTLEHVASVTKISPHNLEALEAGKLDQLPSGIFLRGFLRSYARAIGLNPEDVILRYEEGEKAKVSEVKPAVQIPQKKPPKRSSRPISGVVIFIIIATIVIALATYLSSPASVGCSVRKHGNKCGAGASPEPVGRRRARLDSLASFRRRDGPSSARRASFGEVSLHASRGASR